MSIYDEVIEEQDQQPAKPKSIYDEVIRDMSREREIRMRGSMSQAVETTPDRAAEARRIATQMGLDPSVVERNLDDFKKRAELVETPYSRIQRDTPALADWMAEPSNAAVARDDVPRLGRINTTLTWGESIMRGVDQAKSMFYSFVEATGELAGIETLKETGREGREWFEAEVRLYGDRTSVFSIKSPGEFFQWAKETIGEQIPIMAPMIAGGITGAKVGAGAGTVVVPGLGTVGGATLGGLIGAFIPAFAMGVGETQSAIKQADPNAEAPAAAFLGGSAVAAFDTVLPGKIGSRLVRTFGFEVAEEVAKRALRAPVRPTYLRAGGSAIATEALTEAVQEGISATAAAMGTDTALPADLWRQMVEAGAAGALVGGATAAPVITAERRAIDRQIAAGEQRKVFYESLAQGVTESKLYQRLPEAMQDFIAKATKGGPIETVYAPVDRWTEFFQGQNIDPAAMAAEVTGRPDAYQVALEAGTDIEIPLAAYAVKLAPTEYHAGLIEDLRFRPDEMTLAEARAAQMALEQEEATPPPAPSAPEPVTPPDPAIVEVVKQRVESIGVPTGMDVDAYVQAIVQPLNAIARRAVLDPLTTFEKYGPILDRPDVPTPAPDARQVSARVIELEAMATDEAMGVTFTEDEGSLLPDGSAAVNCTNCARRIIELNGGQGEIYGWEEGSNPSSIVAGPTHGAMLDEGQGHDFAIIDGRFIVDAWAKNVEGSAPRAVFDMNSPIDRREIRRLYGDPRSWMRLEDGKWIPTYPPQLDALVDEIDLGRPDVGTPTFDLRGDVTTETKLEQGAHHGTPHEVKRFKTEFIGTGEGAQTYGWGLYFAQKRDVAEGYFARLVGRRPLRRLRLGSLVLGEWNNYDYSPKTSSDYENVRSTLAETLLIDEAALLDAAAGGAPAVRRFVLANLDDIITRYEQEWPDGLTAAKQLRADLERPGQIGVSFGRVSGGVYTVDIADAAIAEMIDHDAPLAKQTARVKEAVRQELKRRGFLRENDNGPRVLLSAWRAAKLSMSGGDTGGAIYDMFVEREQERLLVESRRRFDDELEAQIAARPNEDVAGLAAALRLKARERATAEAPKAASLALLNAGIRGVKYLDQGSREKGARKTYNFVVFDENDVTITHKNGVPFEQTLYQRGLGELPPGAAINQNTFYSRLQKAVEDAKTAKASGAQWKATIRNSKLGINRDEYALTSVDDLEDGKSYTKEEVLEYLRLNQVQVDVIDLDTYNAEMSKEDARRLQEVEDEIRWEMEQDEWDYYVTYNSPSFETSTEQMEDPDWEAPEDDPDAEPPTIWIASVRDEDGQWREFTDEKFETEREAENYADEKRDEMREEWEESAHENFYNDVEIDEAEVERLARRRLHLDDDKKEAGPRYSEYSYKDLPQELYDEKEIFLVAPDASIPVDSLELLSDADLITAATAYASSNTLIHVGLLRQEEVDDLEIQMEPEVKIADREQFIGWIKRSATERGHSRIPREWEDGHDEYSDVQNPIVRIRMNVRKVGVDEPTGGTTWRKILFLEEVQPPHPESQEVMPALFVKNWRQLAMKWAVRYAAARGMDAIAWTRGDVQARRYRLDTVISGLEWSTELRTIRTRYKGEQRSHDLHARVVNLQTLRYGTLTLVVSQATQRVIMSDRAELVGPKLHEVVGKRIAASILNGAKGKIDDEELKLGGEGLAKIYNYDLPNVVNDLPAMKRTKTRVGKIDLAAGFVAVERDGVVRFFRSRHEADIAVAEAQYAILRAEQAARQFPNTFIPSPARIVEGAEDLHPGVELTPELRAEIIKPQTLFQGKPARNTEASYQTDIFGRPLSSAIDLGAGPGVGVPGVPTEDAGAGTFATRTRLVSVAEKEIGAATVTTADEAATALAYLSKGAVERFDALVTDRLGKPLAVIGSFKGSVDAAPVFVSTLLAEAVQIEGAARIWAAHNHPSGREAESRDDRAVASRLAIAFDGTGIDFMGSIQIGAGRYSFIPPTTAPSVFDVRVRDVAPSTSTARVPVQEREIVERGTLVDETVQPETIGRTVQQIAGDAFGLVMLDAHLRPTGFLPMNRDEAQHLRMDRRVNTVLKALSTANAVQVVIATGAGGDRYDARNLGAMLQRHGYEVLDVVAGGKSTAALYGAVDFPGDYQQEDAEGARGAIRFGGPDGKFRIDLFARADPSTLLHELGHLYLEMMGDVAGVVAGIEAGKRAPTQQKLLEDYAAILKHLGVTRREDIGNEQHEVFARSFEAYLMEGRAPSLELKAAFARFRQWLVGIYRTIRGLNVTLSDEIRGVFDRMVATDEQIARAEQDYGVTPLFTTPETAKMSPAEFELYMAQVADAGRKRREVLDAKLQADLRRKSTKRWKQMRAEVRKEVAERVGQEPVYRAIAAMARGEEPDGTPLEEPLKLSRQAIVQDYGEDRLKALPRPYVYSNSGTLHPDSVAPIFGFGSGDELLTALTVAEPMKDRIERETDNRMNREHGDILFDGGAIDAARAGFTTEEQDSIVRAELRKLHELRRADAPARRAARQAARDVEREREYERRWFEAEAQLRIAIAEGRQQAEIDRLRNEISELRAQVRGGGVALRAAAVAIPQPAVLRESAQRRIAGMPIRQVRPNDYWVAARRAAKKAIEAAARQDFDAAIAAKTQELVSLSLFREASRVREDVEKRVRSVRRMAKSTERARVGSAGEAYLDALDDLLGRYEFTDVSNKTLGRRGALRAWLKAAEAEGHAVELPEAVLNDARQVNYRELAVEEFLGVTDAIRHIVHVARLKNRLLRAGRDRHFKDVTARLAASIRENAGGKRAPEVARDRRPSERGRRLVASMFAGHRKIASLARELDGFKDGGAAWEAIIRPINEAGQREAMLNAQATQALSALVERAFPGVEKSRLYVRQHVPEINQSLSRMEAIVIALNWGNEQNRQRVRDYEKWSDAQVQAVLDTLRESDWDFVEGVWTFLDSYWDDIAAKQRRVVGLAPEKVEAIPVYTRFGIKRGGYFPLKYDDRLAASAAAHLDVDTANIHRQAAYVAATTRRGHLEARVQNVELPIRRDFGVIFEHVAQVIHDLTHHEMLIDVSRIMRDKDVRAAIYETQGDVVYKQITSTLKDIAFGDVPALHAWEQALNYLRIGATVAGLGWNVTTAFLQPIGLTQSMVRIGPVWVARGLARWLRNPFTMVETVRWIYENSAFMLHRGLTMQREINEIRNQVGANTGRLTGWIDQALRAASLGVVSRRAVADSYFWLIQVMQLVADVPTWLGQYEKAMSRGESHEGAVAQADQAVLDSQGGGQIKDLAQVQRGGPALKVWTNFYSFFNTTYNLTAESVKRTKFSNPISVGRLAVDMLLLYSVPATLGLLLRDSMKPDDEDEDYATKLLMANVSYMSGIMLGLRETSGALQGYYGYEGPAGSRAFSALGRVAQQTSQGEVDAALLRATIDAAGVLFHFPSGQTWRTINGIAALVEGKTDNPAVVVTGAPRR